MITASIVGPTFITVMMSGTTHTINNDHANYADIREALKTKDFDTVEKLINVAQSVINYVSGRVRIVNEQVFYGDFEVKGSIVHRIISMMREGFDAAPMIKFLENLMSNPSKRAVDELYGFLEATALPITDDGCFLAYKKVRNDYLDFYTGTVSNKLASLMTASELASYPKTVGNVTIEVIDGVTTLSMPRNQVDEDKDRTCSNGLHFCSLSYLPAYHGGDGRVMIVKINPMDVVAIPNDYNNAKGRSARYEIIGEHTSEYNEAFTSSVYRGVNPLNADDNYDLTDEEKEDNDDWQCGYDAGEAKAQADVECQLAGNNQAPTSFSKEYRDGFATGYDDTYFISWADAGFTNAGKDVAAGDPYDDTPPVACDDNKEYQIGYADGWHNAKLESI